MEGERWEGEPRGGDISIHVVDSLFNILHCSAETNTIM